MSEELINSAGLETQKDNKVNIVLDASQLDMFQLCNQRFEYRYIKNKSLPTKAKQLDRGTLVHHGMETYYKGLKEKIKFRELLPLVLEAISRISVDQSDLPIEEVARIKDVVAANLEYWECEDQSFEILAVETPFTYLLHEDESIRLFMSGKIDLLVNQHTPKTSYLNMPVDHKSYDRTYETRRLSNQFINYANACNSNYLVVNKIGFQKTLTNEEKHVRKILTYDPLMIEEWKKNTIKIAYQYLSCIVESSWPLNLTSCDKYNRLCEYYDVCDSSGAEAKFYKLNANYIDIEPWDVTKVLSSSSNGSSKIE